MIRKWQSRVRSERGQVLFLFVGFVTVFLVMAAVVIDLGLWLAERREVQKVADLAAAAGAQELPVGTASGTPDAMTVACKIAGANGYGTGNVDSQCGTSGSAVRVEILCTNHLSPSPPGICSNGGTGAASCTLPATGCDGIRVQVNVDKALLFAKAFDGFEQSEAAQTPVASGAAAGLRWHETDLDSVILLDASRKMGQCGPGSTACPMLPRVIEAANGFVDFLFDTSTSSRVGEASFNFCYDPPFDFQVGGENQCIAVADHVIGLTSDATALHDTINANIAWGGRNVCTGLLQAEQLLASARDGVLQTLLLLTDGDNNFNYGTSTTYPPARCRASGNAIQPNVCSAALTAEREMDVLTDDLASELKANGVEIYVIGFDVCGPGGLSNDDGNTQQTPGYCAGIGNAQSDNFADQRLLKCVASSPSHFFRVSSSGLSNLPNVFRQIAAAMLGTRLLQ